MGDKNETKDLAALSGAALLDHYLTSVQEQLKFVLDGSKTLDKHSKANLVFDLSKLRTIIGHTSSNKITSNYLVKKINLLVDQLYCPVEYYPYTLTCIRGVQKAINWAIQGHFSNKEEVQDTSLLSVLQNVRVLKNKNLVSESFMKRIKGDDYDDD